ncbi:MFS transporter [Nonomuraea sp. NPDC050547]|uniref:MFS transporter n=1 Tax=Nonomuraea sp. NPDC050547 TaxID=3364368 RepID=UPI0037920007
MKGSQNPWVVLTILCASLFIVVIDITVLYTALPMLSAELGPSSSQVLWIADVYSLVCAPLLLPFAALGDRYGRRAMLLWGYAVFGLASLAAAFAPNVAILIVARAILGLGGAMIMPSTLSMIRQVFTDPKPRATALGVWSAVAAGGAIIGPLVGGALVEWTWWGAVFLINVPVMLAAIPLTLLLVPESPRADSGRWDALGALLATGGVLSLAFGIKTAGHESLFAPPALASWAGAAVLLMWFVRRQLRAAEPLLEVRLFANPAFSTAAVSILVTFLVLVGLELFFTQYLQLVVGLGPLSAALRILPMSVTSVLGSLAGGPLVARFGAPPLVAAGLVGTSVALAPLVTLTTTDQPWLIGLCFAAMGFSLSVALTAASNAMMNAVATEHAGQAAAVEETSYELGGGLGIAVLGSVMSAAFAACFPHAGVVRDSALALRSAYPQIAESARETFVASLHLTVIVSAALLMITGLVIVVVLRRHPRIAPNLGEKA